MNTHTPGPWRISEVDPLAGWSGNPCISITVDANGDGEWSSTVVKEMEAKHRANAYLIAAAPQLLEALESLEDAICSDPDHEEGLPLHYRGKVEAARMVIAKARGAA